eukprot:Selendium_serpulae@DN6163_c1_g1_i5.p2
MIQNEESHEDEKRVAIDAQIDRTLKRNRSDAKRAKHTDPKNSDFEFAAMRHLSTRTIGVRLLNSLKHKQSVSIRMTGAIVTATNHSLNNCAFQETGRSKKEM